MHKLLEDVAARCPGGKLPDTYVVFDTETSGVDVNACRILQYGMTFVENRKRTSNNFTALVKHKEPVVIHPKAIEVHKITNEVLQARGEPPELLVPLIIETLKQWKPKGMLVGHNVLNYDLPILRREAKAIGVDIEYGENEIIDTGMIVKAAQLDWRMDARDTLCTFWRRVSAKFAKGVYWSLAGHCAPTYKLNRFVDPSRAHDAGVDCDLTHYLLETLRDLAQEQPEVQ